MKTTNALPLALALTLAPPASFSATDNALLSTLRRTYPNTTFDTVRRSEIPGLYEVHMGQNVAYVAASRPHYFLFGHLYDARSGKDLTKARLEARLVPSASLSKVALDTLPLADALKSIRGTGEKTIVVFTDPACPYCQRLDAELEKVPNTTVYNFMLPFLGEALPQAVWCASERQLAWKSAMRGQLVPLDMEPCENPLDRNKALAARLHIVGTPTLLFLSGERLEGLVSAEEILQRLASKEFPPPPYPRSQP
jgi:thiol:disulfide interchange protein DsbC